MEKKLSRILSYSNKLIPVALTEMIKFIFRAVFEVLLYGVLFLFSLRSSIGLMLLLCLIFLTVKKDVKMAFVDPEDINYERKTDKELYVFLLHMCVTAFIFAIISFQIFLYIALLFWFYFIIFVLMFSRVWKFHGKKKFSLFTAVISAIIISFIAAPAARDVIYEVLSLFLRH